VTARGVAVFGVGKRVLETALPAFQKLPRSFWIQSVWGRTARIESAGGVRHEVRRFETLTLRDLDGVDLVYVCVAKDAVPQVLARLVELEPFNRDLLIDTPVVRFKHFRHAARARAFRQAWVAEDCIELPWIPAALAAVGPLHRVEFERSAYAYHGIATARALFAARSIPSARRVALPGGAHERTLRFSGGRVARIVEPRDYANGRLVFIGQGGSLSDAPEPGEGRFRLSPELTDGAVTAITAGPVRLPLDATESELTVGDARDATLTARQDAMKRVGFLRLLRRISANKGAHPLELGLEDMVVDYALEKLGRWHSTPLTTPRSALGRAAYALATLPVRA
jgi:hypothetical protein